VLIEQERQYKQPNYEGILNFFFLAGFNKNLHALSNFVLNNPKTLI